MVKITISTEMQDSLNQIINQHGERVVVYQHSSSITQPYDEESLTVIGSVLGSVFFLPVSENRNGQDFRYVEEGIVKMDDLKMFSKSGLNVRETDIIAIPSLTGSFSIVKKFDYIVNGTLVYNKIYLRRFVV